MGNDTTWESLAKNITYHLIAALPGIIANGYHQGGLNIQPYRDITLPDLSDYDTQQQLPLCPLFSNETDDTRLSLRSSKLNGLDTVGKYAPITFPQQDVLMTVPLLVSTLTVTGDWSTSSGCQDESGQITTTVHQGGFTMRLTDVQFSVTVDLDVDQGAATNVDIKLTDQNQQWSNQPTFNPDQDITFDSSVSRGKRAVLLPLLSTDTVRTTLRDNAKGVIEDPRLATNLKQIINQLFQM
jgi:hypothetical protein